MNNEALVLTGPSHTKMDGRFYNCGMIRSDGSYGHLTLPVVTTPFRSYGINKWNSIFLYIDDNVEDLKEFGRKYVLLEDKLKNILKDKGEMYSVCSRLTETKRGGDNKRLVVKADESTVFTDIGGNTMSFDNGIKSDVYPVITMRSVYVHQDKGMTPQLFVTKACVVPVDDRCDVELDMDAIRRRYKKF